MSSLAALFERNRKWASRMREADPDVFGRLAEEQNPRYLWIGCSDSRVPASHIVDLPPGNLFVHRNIANIVHYADLNVASVLHFAIKHLDVSNVIVCGHYGCGGIQAAMEGDVDAPLAHWLRGVRELFIANRAELDALDGEEARFRRLCELNVLEQVENVAGCPAAVERWHAGRPLSVHGLMYDLETGHLHDMGHTVSAALGR